MSLDRAIICALLFRRVGDSLLATPALRALKKHFPDKRLIVIVEPQVMRVFQHNPWVDDVLEVPRSPSPLQLARTIRRFGGSEITVDFLSDPRSAIACRLTGAKRRVGFAYPKRSWLYTDLVPRQDPKHPVYSAEHKLALSTVLGARQEPLDTDFVISDADSKAVNIWLQSRSLPPDRPLISIFPFSRRSYKRWPSEHYASLCHILHTEHRCNVLLLAGPGEFEYCMEIASRSDLPRERIFEAPDIGQLAALLKASTLLAGNDGGPKHISVAMGTPTVTIFGNDPPAYWTPPDSDLHRAIIIPENTESSAELSMAVIRPELVFEEIQSVLNRIRP